MASTTKGGALQTWLPGHVPLAGQEEDRRHPGPRSASGGFHRGSLPHGQAPANASAFGRINLSLTNRDRQPSQPCLACRSHRHPDPGGLLVFLAAVRSYPNVGHTAGGSSPFSTTIRVTRWIVPSFDRRPRPFCSIYLSRIVFRFWITRSASAFFMSSAIRSDARRPSLVSGTLYSTSMVSFVP